MYNSDNGRCTYKLLIHVILVCKYRKPLLNDNNISNLIKQFSLEIMSKWNIKIKYMETDKDHIHYLLDIPPKYSISKIISVLKSYTTYYIWKSYDLSNHFWKRKIFWTSGYFSSSIGNVSEENIKKYIENQGK